MCPAGRAHFHVLVFYQKINMCHSDQIKSGCLKGQDEKEEFRHDFKKLCFTER